MEKKASDYKRKGILNFICMLLWAAAALFEIKDGGRIGFFYLILSILFLSITIANYKKYKREIEEENTK